MSKAIRPSSSVKSFLRRSATEVFSSFAVSWPKRHVFWITVLQMGVVCKLEIEILEHFVGLYRILALFSFASVALHPLGESFF